MKLTNFTRSLLISALFTVYLLLGAGIFYAIEKDAEEPMDRTLAFMLKVASEKQLAGIQMGMTKAVPRVTEAYKAETQKEVFDASDVAKIAVMSLDQVLEQAKHKIAEAVGEKTGEPQAQKHSANGDVDLKTEPNGSENPSYNSVPEDDAAHEEARVKRQAEAEQNETATEPATDTTALPTTPTPSGGGDDHDHKSGFGSFVFLALTSMSTVGYGNIYPKTAGGRLFFIIFSTLGVPLFFCIALSMALTNRRMIISAHSKLLELLHREAMGTRAKNVTRFLLAFNFWLVVLVLMCAAIFHHVEGWEYLDAIYFEFATLFTVGFGDLYPGVMLGLGDPREVSHALRAVYMIFVLFYIIFGISWIFTLALMVYDCCTTKHQTKEISRANGVATPPKIKVENEEKKDEDIEKTEEPLLDETETEKVEEKEMEEIKPEDVENAA